MTFLSARRPLIAALGATAILAVGGMAPGAFAAADTTDDPSDLIAHVHVTLQLSDSSVRPGAHVTATMTVVAEEPVPSTMTRWTISAGGAQVSPASGTLGTVYLAPKSVTAQITVPSSASARSITVDAVVTGPRLVTAASDAKSFQVVPGTVDKPTTPPKPKPTPKPTHSKPPTNTPHDPGNNGTPNGGGGAIPSLPFTGAPTAPPEPGVDAPEVALPPVSAPQVATATPDQVAVASTRTALRSAESALPLAQRIGPGAAGWMAALLAGQILLMLRVRMVRRSRGREPVRRFAAAATAADVPLALPRPTATLPDSSKAASASEPAPAPGKTPRRKKASAAKKASGAKKTSAAAKESGAEKLPAAAKESGAEKLPAAEKAPAPENASAPELAPAFTQEPKPEAAPEPASTQAPVPEAIPESGITPELKTALELEAASEAEAPSGPVTGSEPEPAAGTAAESEPEPAPAAAPEPERAKAKSLKSRSARRSAAKTAKSAPATGRAAKRRGKRRFSLLPDEPGRS
ncbi:hypothetical protein BTM25_17970 [Actinomadura rubteroloni]|uniref:Uncharacterized protein n=1 Tax=Actinomadura rubteroloni TaxID=1926885 RepID=A0A2P4UQR9_9ACTN|nr:hypothetical protein [Actinomadura rubteroloni]POM27383.1 hypothetical protein BTM25_17970 [Actinomadura rubteroloni]